MLLVCSPEAKGDGNAWISMFPATTNRRNEGVAGGDHWVGWSSFEVGLGRHERNEVEAQSKSRKRKARTWEKTNMGWLRISETIMFLPPEGSLEPLFISFALHVFSMLKILCQ